MFKETSGSLELKRGTQAPANTSAQGFTLIEILIVVAVLAVLLAILLPCLGKARIQARRIQCQGNLRNIVQGYDMYLGDNNEMYYTLRMEGNTVIGKNAEYTFGGWKGSENTIKRPVNRYTDTAINVHDANTAEVFWCPSDRGGHEYYPDRTFNSTGNSYQANPALTNRELMVEAGWYPEPWREINQLIRSRSPKKRTNVSQPSRVIFMGDYHWADQWDATWYECTYQALHNWHGKRHYFNMAFVDGHIEHIRIIRGIYATSKYKLSPSSKLDSAIKSKQQEKLCLCGKP